MNNLANGMNRRGTAVANALNPEPFSQQSAAFVCRVTVCEEQTISETTRLATAGRTEDLDTVSETIDKNCDTEIP